MHQNRYLVDCNHVGQHFPDTAGIDVAGETVAVAGAAVVVVVAGS